jgi:hypothetical protein
MRINARLDDCGRAGLCVLIALLLTAPPAIWAGMTGQAAPLPLAVGLLATGLVAALTVKAIAVMRNWRSILRELDRLTLPAPSQPSMRIAALVGS